MQTAETLRVTPDTLTMQIPMFALHELPPGAEFSTRRGGTRLSVGRRGDTLTVGAETTLGTARCTSVTRSTAVQHARKHAATEHEERPAQPSATPMTRLRDRLCLMGGLVAASLAFMLMMWAAVKAAGKI